MKMIICLLLVLITIIVYKGLKLFHYYSTLHNGMHIEDKMKKSVLYIVKFPATASFLAKVMVMIYYLFVRRKPQESSNAFTYHKNTSYKIFLGAILFSSVLECVGFFFLLHRWSPLISWLHTIVVVICILFLISDYKAVKLKPITINGRTLHLHLGLKMSEDIELSSIKTIQNAQISLEETKKDKSILKMMLIELEDPNVEIHLNTPLTQKGLLGRKREISTVLLAVDERDSFIREVKKAQSQANETLAQNY